MFRIVIVIVIVIPWCRLLIIIITIIITICRHRSIEQMTDKRLIVRRNRGLFNSNRGPSHTNKKVPEIYFEAARHQTAMQKMWQRIGDNPTHYCSMWATGSYRVCEETWWTGQHFPSETGYNSSNNKLQLGCHPVAVVILHVNKTWNWLLLNLSPEGYMRSM